jgi:regulator of protease activity HflC (stomatin/prohibitin superfamily)
MGIEVVSVRISAIRPDADMERALQTPAQEDIQQQADEARFSRRALAVQKERAISENELQNQIELAIREEQLIAQRGVNEQRRVSDEAQALQVTAEASAERRRINDIASAKGTEVIEAAKNTAERDRISIYEELSPDIVMALAMRELAGNLPDIEHLNLSPDLLGPALQRLMTASTSALEAK